MTFDLNKEIEQLNGLKKLRTKKRHKPSKLDKYQYQLRKFYENGHTKADLQLWLARRGVKVHWTTVKRWIDKNA
jgi:hypothetical protein